MRILVIGDIHCCLTELAWIILEVERKHIKFDHVLVTGDIGADVLPEFGREATDMETEVYASSVDAVWGLLEVLLALAQQPAHAKVLFVPGNHDTASLAGRESIINIDVLSANSQSPFVDSTGLEFYGIGGSTPTGPERMKLFSNEWDDSDKNVREKIARIKPQGRWVLLSHAPPAGTILDKALTPPSFHACGSRLVSDLISTGRPALTVCGHIHERPYMRPDIIGGQPVYNAAGIYWPEQIHFLDKHYLPDVDMVMTIRFAIVGLRESGEITFRQFGAIAQSSCELTPTTYTVRDGSLFVEEEGSWIPVRTTDRMRRRRGTRSRLSDSLPPSPLTDSR